MPRFTESRLRDLYGRSTNFFIERRSAMLNESKKPNPQFDIFLSHSYLDKEVIYGLFIFLSRKGYKVYVDWVVDKNLDRTSVNKRTADVIKKRMEQSDTLFHATSINTKRSNWMPWETGYMDARTDKCAIVEIITNKYETFKSQEYLLLYPFVTEEISVNRQSITCINNRDTSNKILFEEWKKGKKP